MNQYRITKYNPNNRNEQGQYQDTDEWTGFKEVGERLSLQAYELVEAAYIESALEIMTMGGVSQLTVAGLEDHAKVSGLKEGDSLRLDDLGVVLRSLLREAFWCRLESDRGFIHIGWDFYMYVGAQRVSPVALKRAEQRGLYVEVMTSPYHTAN